MKMLTRSVSFRENMFLRVSAIAPIHIGARTEVFKMTLNKYTDTTGRNGKVDTKFNGIHQYLLTGLRALRFLQSRKEALGKAKLILNITLQEITALNFKPKYSVS